MSEAGVAVLTQSARALDRVVHAGRSADAVLGGEVSATSAVRAVTLGALRWYGRLDALLLALLGPTRVVPRVRMLLLAALHQLEYSRTAPELVVSMAVDAVRALGQPRAAGLVNALLRRYLRERDQLLARAFKDEASLFAHPRWLLRALQQHWPAFWRDIVDSNNRHPPMTLRVNLSRISLSAYQALLTARAIAAQPVPWAGAALILEQPVGVHELPGFSEGLVSVQDAGAQLAARLLGANAGDRVLDACAAPGGKTGSILEMTPSGLEMVAVDVDEARLNRIGDNLARLRLDARCVRADLTQPPAWWDRRPFDRILVDAPCSATGVIRRHPDIKLLRRSSDIDGFVASQRSILKHCLSMLKRGGRLLYSTCSLLPEENERLVWQVLHETPNVSSAEWPTDVSLPPQGQPCRFGMQLLPGCTTLTDGFYYACLTVS